MPFFERLVTPDDPDPARNPNAGTKHKHDPDEQVRPELTAPRRAGKSDDASAQKRKG